MSAINWASKFQAKKRTTFVVPYHFNNNTSASLTSKPAENSTSVRNRERKRAGNKNKPPKAKAITQKFVCLADKEQSESPDREEQRDLLGTGLGETKVSVPEEACEKEICELLIKAFRKLNESGLIRIYVCGNT